MKDLGNTIYAFGCVAAATVLGIGFADYWFGHHPGSGGGLGQQAMESRAAIARRCPDQTAEPCVTQ